MSAGQFGDNALDRRCLNLPLFIPSITLSIIASVSWFEPTEKSLPLSSTRFIERPRKLKVTKKAKKQREIKVFRKLLCGPLQRYNLQHAMKLRFEVNFRFFDCCRRKVLGRHGLMKRKSVAVCVKQACWRTMCHQSALARLSERQRVQLSLIDSDRC